MYPEQLIHEIIDSAVPIYNHDLACLLADEPDIGFPGDLPSTEIPDGGIFQIIQWSIYERLREHANEVWPEIECEHSENAFKLIEPNNDIGPDEVYEGYASLEAAKIAATEIGLSSFQIWQGDILRYEAPEQS